MASPDETKLTGGSVYSKYPAETTLGEIRAMIKGTKIRIQKITSADGSSVFEVIKYVDAYHGREMKRLQVYMMCERCGS